MSRSRSTVPTAAPAAFARPRLTLVVGGLILGAAALAATVPAHAQGVHWSIGIQLPPVAAVISSPPVPVYGPPPVVYAPPPVIYQPPPRIVHPAPPVVYYPPAAVVYRPPPPVIYAPPAYYVPPGWHKGRGYWKDRDHDGVPDRWERRYR